MTQSVVGARSYADAVTWLSAYVVLLFLVPSKLVVGPLGSAGALSMLAGLLSLVLWVLFRVGSAVRSPIDPQPLALSLFVFLFSVGVTYALAMSRPISPDEISPADVALLSLASWAGTLLLAHDGIADRIRLDTLLWRISLCGAAIGLLGVIQVLTSRVWVDMITFPGLTVVEAAATYSRGSFLRPAGTAVHPIEYGVLVTMLLPVALHVALHHTKRHKIIRWLPAVTLAAVVPMTLSRSAYLGAIIGCGIYVLGWPPVRRNIAIALGAVGFVMMSIITPSLFNSITTLFTGVSEDPSIASRTGSFDLAGEFIARQPFFGRGLGTFLPKYRIFDNQYLNLLLQVGVIGTVCFLLIGATAVILLLRLRRDLKAAPRRDPQEPSRRDLALALIASVSVGFVSLTFFDAFAFPMTMGTLFLMLGIAGALNRIERRIMAGAAPADLGSVADARAALRGLGKLATRPPAGAQADPT